LTTTSPSPHPPAQRRGFFSPRAVILPSGLYAESPKTRVFSRQMPDSAPHLRLFPPSIVCLERTSPLERRIFLLLPVAHSLGSSRAVTACHCTICRSPSVRGDAYFRMVPHFTDLLSHPSPRGTIHPQSFPQSYPAGSFCVGQLPTTRHRRSVLLFFFHRLVSVLICPVHSIRP